MGIQLAPSDTCQVWLISDKFSKGTSLASVTSIRTLLPGREPVPQMSSKSKHWVKPKRRVFWCVLSLTPLMTGRAGVQPISNRLPWAAPSTRRIQKKIPDSYFLLVLLHLAISLGSAELGVGWPIQSASLATSPWPLHLGRKVSVHDTWASSFFFPLPSVWCYYISLLCFCFLSYPLWCPQINFLLLPSLFSTNNIFQVETLSPSTYSLFNNWSTQSPCLYHPFIYY